MFVFVIMGMSTIAISLGLVYRRRSGRATTTASLKGKTVLITGASSGIGREAAKDLAQRGARVILACRNLQKASQVASDIEEATGSKSVVVMKVDTSSLASVREFAAKFLAKERRLDVLVLNAGIGGRQKKTLTSDNLELTMATNHFGHFLLTNLLLGLLKASQPSRVVVVSCMIHSNVQTLDIENLNFTKEGTYWPVQAYAQSKACNILFTRYLANLLKDYGVAVNSMCPGFVSSDIFAKSESFIAGYVYNYLAPILAKTVEQGAQTIIQLAASDENPAPTGGFYEDCRVSDNATNLVLDEGLAKKVWEASESLVGLQPEEQHY